MKYYHIDANPFGTRVKLCFDQDGVDSILKDHDIDFTVDAFDMGIAETHYISDGREGIIVVIIDLDKCDHDRNFQCGIVAHEAYHVACRIFEHIGQPIHTVGEEIVAYTLEHLTKQIAAATELEENARKASRSALKQARKVKRRIELQVDQLGDGSAGSNSDTELEGFLRRAENKVGIAFCEAEASVPANCGSGLSRKSI